MNEDRRTYQQQALAAMMAEYVQQDTILRDQRMPENRAWRESMLQHLTSLISKQIAALADGAKEGRDA